MLQIAVSTKLPIQYLVRETATESAQEIASEFYPTDDPVPGEHVDSPNEAMEDEELRPRICELARRLGYREVKTRMLFAQWGAQIWLAWCLNSRPN
jgi:hypothetical protein